MGWGVSGPLVSPVVRCPSTLSLAANSQLTSLLPGAFSSTPQLQVPSIIPSFCPHIPLTETGPELQPALPTVPVLTVLPAPAPRPQGKQQYPHLPLYRGPGTANSARGAGILLIQFCYFILKTILNFSCFSVFVLFVFIYFVLCYTMYGHPHNS